MEKCFGLLGTCFLASFHTTTSGGTTGAGHGRHGSAAIQLKSQGGREVVNNVLGLGSGWQGEELLVLTIHLGM